MRVKVAKSESEDERSVGNRGNGGEGEKRGQELVLHADIF
jgi:hypothetical protein